MWYTHTHTHTHTHTEEYYAAIKKNILPWMDLERIMLSNMSDREREMLYDITCMWNTKNTTN